MPPRRLEKDLRLAVHDARARGPERTRVRSPVPSRISSSSTPVPKQSATATPARRARLCPAALRAAPTRSESVRPPPCWPTALLPGLLPVANSQWPAEPIWPGCNVEQELRVGSRRHPETAAQGHLLYVRAVRVALQVAACHRPRPAPGHA